MLNAREGSIYITRNAAYMLHVMRIGKINLKMKTIEMVATTELNDYF